MTRKALIKKTDNNKTTVDNNNFMIMILILSGLDLSDLIEDIYFPDDNFPDLTLIQEVISKSSTISSKIKYKILSKLIDIIFTEIYNQYFYFNLVMIFRITLLR